MRRLLFLGLIITSHFLYGQSNTPAIDGGKMVLDLRQTVDIALERNLNIKRSELTLRGAEVNLTQSKMNRLPNANVGVGAGRNWGRSVDPTTNQFITLPLYFAGVQGSSNMTLFNGMQLHNTVRRNELTKNANEFDLEKSKNDVIVTVVTSYLNVILNQELVETARLQAESTRNQLERTVKLVDAGSLPITNQLDLESQLASNELDLINAENDLALSQLSLKQALLLPSTTEVELIVPEVDVPNELNLDDDVEGIYRTALEAMPEIKSADLNVQSAEVGLRVAQGGIMPTLSLGASFNTNYSEIADREREIYDGTTFAEFPIGFLENDRSQLVYTRQQVPNVVSTEPDFPVFEQFSEYLSKQINLNLSVPIFNRFTTRSNVQRAIITQKTAEISALETRNTLRQNIETAYNNANAALKSYNASERQVSALEQSFKNTENRYSLGAVNFVEYQVASNNLFRARSGLVRAKYTYLFRLKILEFYQGKELTF
ncbi:MAG: TolC family protein [Imperialibacter sp.]|uniref:TolC family protein n=1 Tax=Imperialibacter sp. TaxID=2038411 RepID=UPI0032EDC521